MKKMFFIAVAMFAMLTTVSCKKEVETIIERVEVQKGNLILSGIGAPDASLGNVGDYYLDLSNSYLYGAKTAQGWGLPISLKGIQGDKGDKGDTGATGQKGDKGEQGIPGQNGSKIYAGKGMPTSNIGNIGDWYIDSENKRFYGPKGNGGWSNEYIDLKSQAHHTPLNKNDFGTNNGLIGFNMRTNYVDMNAYEWLKDVGSISKRGFKEFFYLKTFIFSDNVTDIKEEAFIQCHGLTTVVFPKNLVTIENRAFSQCIYNHRTTKTNQKYPSVNL